MKGTLRNILGFQLRPYTWAWIVDIHQWILLFFSLSIISSFIQFFLSSSSSSSPPSTSSSIFCILSISFFFLAILSNSQGLINPSLPLPFIFDSTTSSIKSPDYVTWDPVGSARVNHVLRDTRNVAKERMKRRTHTHTHKRTVHRTSADVKKKKKRLIFPPPFFFSLHLFHETLKPSKHRSKVE